MTEGTRERHRKASEIFAEICDLPKGRREARLAQACGQDTELLKEVASLLDFHAPARPAPRTAPKLLHEPLLRRPRTLVLAGLGFLGLVAGLGLWAVRGVEEAILDARVRELRSTVESRAAALRAWTRFQKDRFRAVAAQPDLFRPARVLAAAPSDDAARASVEKFMARIPRSLCAGYALVGVEGETMVGTATRKVRDLLVERGLRGEVFVARSEDTTLPPVLWLGGPILGEDGRVIALLSMSFESAPIFPGIFDGALVDGAEAYEQQAKLDGRGYRDTRGEEMIGAWTWLPEWEIGMGAEMDRTEVLRPVSRLRKTLAFLFGGVAGLTALLIAIGHRFGRAVAGNYALEGLIGRGGAAEVYRARHVHLERPAAVKVLMATDSESMARFGREARLVSRLSHPNTIQIYDYGRTGDGRFYFAMELVEGLTLSHVVTLGGPLPVARVVHLLDQICGSLEEAHAAGVLHHDIKPANVMLCRRGGRCDLVKVLDFGIAGSDEEARERSRVAGTPVYIAPERLCSSRTAGPRSDLYSLGALAFFLLTGRDVFEGETPSGILTQGLSADPPSPSLLRGAPIAEELETLVLDLLAKEPGRRPASAAEVRDRLASVVRSEPWSPEEALAWWTDRETRISRLVREKGER